MSSTGPCHWLPGEVVILRDLYGKITNRRIGRQLSRSEADVAKKAKELHLVGAESISSRPVRWTAEDLRLMVELFPSKTNAELASILNRSEKAIASKGAKMRLNKSRDHRREVGAINVKLRRDRAAADDAALCDEDHESTPEKHGENES